METPSVGLADIVALLSRAEFFSRLLPDDMYWLASKAEPFRCRQGAAIFSPGEKATRFFIVRSGAVAIAKADESGRPMEMARFVAGDVVADFDFARGASYDASARCAEDSELLAFPARGSTMDDLARERPDIVARVLLRSVAMISARVRSTQALISTNAPWVRELRRQMYTDSGTGLWSRAFLDEELARTLEAPAAIVLVKPDRFKELCDAWGHKAGDEAMVRIAAILKDEARALCKAWAVRLRSNETAIVASACTRDAARALGARLLEAYARIDLSRTTNGSGFWLTASVATSSWPEDGADFRGLVERTYGLLMRVWKDGGARVRDLAEEGAER